MIALPSIAFGGFSGSAKGVTARYQSGRSILSLKSYPTGFATAAQLARRSSLSRISKAYKNLTESEMKAWEKLAEQSNGKSVFGQKSKLSAHNLFVRLNSNRAYCGETTLLTVPPTTVNDIPTVDFADFKLSENLILFTDVPDPSKYLLLVAKMTTGQSKGVSSSWDKTVIISPDKVPDWGDVDLTDAFVSVFGHYPVGGQKYFIEMYWLEPESGFTGPVTRVSGICEETVEVVERLTLKNKDIVQETANYFLDLDMEFAPGSTILTTEMSYDSTGHDTQQAICNLSDEAAARTPAFKSFVLGRSLEEKGYLPYFFQIHKRRWSNKEELCANRRGGPWEKKGIIFGTCPVFEP